MSGRSARILGWTITVAFGAATAALLAGIAAIGKRPRQGHRGR